MNVLLTSAGRRNYLVSYFREALKGRGQVIVTDADPNAAALQAADRAFIAPKFDDPAYIRFLVDVCRNHNINVLISLNDLELPLIAQEKEMFWQIGVCAVISSSELIDKCLDKWETFRMLSCAGIDTPNTFISLHEAQEALESDGLNFPVVVKPRWGTGSIGIEMAYSREELVWAYNLISHKLERTILSKISRKDFRRTVVIQEFVDGSEYGLDVINDLDGRYVCTFAKQKLGMRAGETDKAVTVNAPELEALGRRIGTLTKHVAIMDCDVIVTKDGRISVLELNPRFGGGYPFAHVAGANIPAAILAWAEGREPRVDWFNVKPNITASKYDMLALIPPCT